MEMNKQRREGMREERRGEGSGGKGWKGRVLVREGKVLVRGGEEKGREGRGGCW